MTFSVVVADDDPRVLAALCALLEADHRFVVVARVRSGPDAVAAVLEHEADAVLLDVRMPGGGLRAALELQAAEHAATVIAVSAQVDPTLVAQLLQAGVRGIFTKGRIGQALPDLVAQCCSGEVVLATPAAGTGFDVFGVGPG